MYEAMLFSFKVGGGIMICLGILALVVHGLMLWLERLFPDVDDSDN